MMQLEQTAQAVETQIDSLLAKMSLAEKIGQMTQPEKNSIPPEDVTAYFIGSVLSGGGGNPEPNTPQAWLQMTRSYQEAALKTPLGIPLIYGVDAVHGHNNVVGAVIFPHNVGLGAAGDADLVKRIADATARELMATGVHWNFAPAVSVPQDIRWGRSYEGYSEKTDIVTPLAIAYVRGLQEANVLPSVKHYIGDGGTSWGTTRTYAWINGNWQAPGSAYHIDQGDTQVDEGTLRAVHLPPYQAAIEAGVLNIMVSFSSWQGLKMHAHRYLLTDLLKNELGFKGFLVSDWMAVNQIDASYRTSVITAINAGVDMVMVPFDYKLFIATLTEAVEAGDVTLERIDDAVRRILRAKISLGLFDAPFGSDALLAEFGGAAHRAVAREAVRKSLVLLKNEGNLVPLPRHLPILVAGRGADNIGMQCGGWSITWQGGHGATTPGTSVLAALKESVDADVSYNIDGLFEGAAKAPLGIVVVGESPYAEGFGDNDDLTLAAEDQAVVARMRERCEKLVVIVLSGRPIIVTEQVTQADAFIAAWLPGTESDGITDVLFGDAPFTGRLSFSWPRSMDQVPLKALQASAEPPLFPLGYGL